MSLISAGSISLDSTFKRAMESTVLMKANTVLTKENTVLTKVNTVFIKKITDSID
jgi:hypothetical protein